MKALTYWLARGWLTLVGVLILAAWAHAAYLHPAEFAAFLALTATVAAVIRVMVGK